VNGIEVVRRLRAYQRGRPLPRGERLAFRIASDPDLLVVAFLRMGGESRPWGVAFGHPGERPKVLTVPEGRNRDLVSAMIAEFAPALLEHLRVPPYAAAPSSEESLDPLRQVWLANVSHLDMLHHLAYAYTFTKAGNEALLLILNALGRACAWLHRESQRPGQQQVMVGTTALRTAFTFPAEDTRQGHLGFLMSLLEAEGGLADRMVAAQDAERLAVSTSLDPDFERTETEPLVDAWQEAKRAGDAHRQRAAEEDLARVLQPELERRYDLIEHAIQRLHGDARTENAGVASLIGKSRRQQWRDHLQTERRLAGIEPGNPYIPSVETDRDPRGAAARYQENVAAAEFVATMFLHDDREMLAEAVMAGDAFRGEIVAVQDEGVGRKTVPVWTVRSKGSGPLRLRVNDSVAFVGFVKRTARIRSLGATSDGRTFEVEITNRKTAKDTEAERNAWACNDVRWVGEDVGFARASSDYLAQLKAQRVWRGGVGDWLTHARAGTVVAEVTT
jgi:hypothetical protein